MFIRRRITGTFAIALLVAAAGITLIEDAEAFPPSTKEEVLGYLNSISGTSIVSGQHNKEPANQPSQYTNQVHDVTGMFPGMWGGELMFNAADVNNRQQVFDQAITEWNNGSLVTFTWHVCPPTIGSSCQFQGGVQSEITNEQFTEVITEGTSLNNAWKARLDEVVPYFQQLEDAGIPAFFRPFHEMNEQWNWWGDRPGENGTARLYQLTRDHLEGTRGLDSLIWVWNVQDNAAGNWASYYPGDSYADVVSLDVWYKTQPSQGDYDQIRSIAGDKPIAITETGWMPNGSTLTNQPDWTYFMVWSEHLLGENTNEEIQATYNHPRVLNQGEISLDG